ncbi:MAG: MFS transporter [Trebonia sp.]
MNIPIGLAVGMAGRVLIPNDSGIGFLEGIDWLGSLLVTVALAAAVYGFVEPSTYGWGSLHTLAPLAVALVLLTAFVAVENRHPNPIFPLRIRKLHGLMLSCAARGLLVTGVYAMFFLGSLYLEKVLGYGALDTGLAFPPYTVTIAILTLGVNGRLVARFGSVPVMAVGLAIAGILMLRLGGTHAGFFPFPFLAFLGMGLGIGNAFGPLTMIAMAEVPPRDAGLASGIVNVSQQVAGALGLALLATIATSHSASLSRAGHGVDASLVGGYHLAFGFGAGALVVALILVVTVLRKHAPRPAPEQAPNPQTAPASQPLDELEANVETPG